MMIFRKRVRVGLDLGSHSIKCAVLEENGRIRYLWEGELLPDRQTQKDKLEGDALKQRVIDLIKQMQKEVPHLPRHVRLAIPADDALCQYLELPSLTTKEMEVAVPSQARKYIPFKVEEVALSWVAVPPLPSTNGVAPKETPQKKSAVFFVAAQKIAANQVRDLVKAGGLEPQRIDISTLALAREFRKNHATENDQFVALVHVGFHLTQVLLVRGPYPYYSRNFQTAGRAFTYGIQMAAQSSWGAAERIKRKGDVAMGLPPHEPALNRWLQEVRRSLQHFHEKVGAAHTVKHIYLSGGSSLMLGLDRRLQDFVEIAVTSDPWERLKVDATAVGQPPSSFKVAVGLALED